MYRAIDPNLLIETLERLTARISARFPGAGLARVCTELTITARATAARAEALGRANVWLRTGIAAVLGAGLALLLALLRGLHLEAGAPEGVDLIQGAEATLNIVLLAGAGVLSLTTLESRLKRAEAMTRLHELRSFVHVIDMHQLTKDPSMIGGARTSASPQRDLSAFELARYLDYCSEMLSLTSKLAALYAQAAREAEIVEAASDIEQIATNLSQKIWQKITILQANSSSAG